VYDVVLLSLAEPEGGCCDGCGDAAAGKAAAGGGVTPSDEHGCAGDCASCTSHGDACDTARRPSAGTRVPVLHCADALRAAGARVELVTARSDEEIDEVLARLDGPPREDGLTWPDADSKVRLVLAVADDGQLRHVIRRMVRRYAPPPSARPADLVTGRTVPDLPTIAVLPLDAAAGQGDLAAQLGIPRRPAAVAQAVLGDRIRRLDLLRHDGGSITLDGVLLGDAGPGGVPTQWQGRIEVDDAVLTDGSDLLVAAAVANAGGVATVDGLPLLTGFDPADGLIDVAVAVPVTHKPFLGKAKIRIEVRRARGRAVSITPRGDDLGFVDDGVSGRLTRKRSWWVEPGAWALFTD
jgi:hypothetical protein